MLALRPLAQRVVHKCLHHAHQRVTVLAQHLSTIAYTLVLPFSQVTLLFIARLWHTVLCHMMTHVRRFPLC